MRRRILLDTGPLYEYLLARDFHEHGEDWIFTRETFHLHTSPGEWKRPHPRTAPSLTGAIWVTSSVFTELSTRLRGLYKHDRPTGRFQKRIWTLLLSEHRRLAGC
jgi:hypothetical protein